MRCPDLLGLLGIVLEGLAGHHFTAVSGKKHPIVAIMRPGDDCHEAALAHGPRDEAGFALPLAAHSVGGIDLEHGLRGSAAAESDASRATDLRHELDAEIEGPPAPA